MNERRPRSGLSARLDELSDASLRGLAGIKAFGRACVYVAEGRVTFVAEVDGGATFEVEGEQRYRTQLSFDESGIEADCTCPSALVSDFCKHAVAAALHWRGQLGGAPTPAPSPRAARSSKAAKSRAENRERLKAFLASQSVADLAARLWAQAEHDTSLMAELKAWAAASRVDDDPKALKQAVGELVAYTGSRVLYGRDVARWAERARAAAPLLQRAIKRTPEAARVAAEHALGRVYVASQHMDDSDGEVGAAMQMLMETIVEALKAARPGPWWAQRFLRLLEADPYGIWEVDLVLDAAGGRCCTSIRPMRHGALGAVRALGCTEAIGRRATVPTFVGAGRLAPTRRSGGAIRLPERVRAQAVRARRAHLVVRAERAASRSHTDCTSRLSRVRRSSGGRKPVARGVRTRWMGRGSPCDPTASLHRKPMRCELWSAARGGGACVGIPNRRTVACHGGSPSNALPRKRRARRERHGRAAVARRTARRSPLARAATQHLS